MFRILTMIGIGFCLIAELLSSAAAVADSYPPVVPVGLDAYLQWERWPFQRIGVRAYLRSTYDRFGGNEGADASHFLYQLDESHNVTLDVDGPGVLYFARFNHWHGSPWNFTVDGREHIVQESTTADPNKPVVGSTFIPQLLFPAPLAYTWSTTHGADLIGVPIPFTSSFQLSYSRTHYGTGYYIFQQFAPGIPLSSPLRAWDGTAPPDQDVLDLVNKAGSDLAPKPNSPLGIKIRVEQVTIPAFVLQKNADQVLEDLLPRSPQMVRSIEFSVPRPEAIDFGKSRLRITWDDRRFPSVDAPIALFFGAGTFYNRDNEEFLVKAFPVNVRFDSDRVYAACYFPMPYFRSMKIELSGNGTSDLTDVRFNMRQEPLKAHRDEVGYFHATYVNQSTPVPGQDLVLLDTTKTEGGGDWCGSIVGTSFIFSDRAGLGTLEGDPRFYFDDSQTPQVQGTGTEEWAGGGDYWGGQNMTLPFYGHPTGARSARAAVNDDDKIESAYRFLLADLMPFGKNAIVGLEHGGIDNSTEHYQTVAYWYGLPGHTLLETDSIKVGDPTSESAHHYASPTASLPYEITSRYERGVDTFNGVETYPATSDWGRTMTGTSEFELKLAANNYGVMLRRKLDYSYPNQRAEVYIADDKARKGVAWKFAGVWLTAGSNTCIYSNPPEELGAAQHTVETSNRRFRDDEFLVPCSLTKGKAAIRVRIKFTPVTTPLYPGFPLSPLAWSEIRYEAYCYVKPTP
jgi:hypothetical protein